MRIIVACLALLMFAGSSFAQSAPSEPPTGRVISGWGQFSSAWNDAAPAGKGDEEDLAAYEKAVAPHAPAMISFYVAADSQQIVKFLRRYREFASTHGFFVAQIGLYFRGFEHDVAIGMRDPEVIALADGLRDVGRPVLLRIGYEFNNPDARYEPSAYIGAFRQVVERMRHDNLNFAAVWDATAYGFSDPHYMKWYPGDDVVDWWGVNLFFPRDFTLPETTAFVGDAERHHKPVLIGETSPLFQSLVPGHVRGANSDAEATQWYATLFGFIRNHSVVKAVSLIAVDWRRLHAILPGWGWPDARLNRLPKATAYVKQQLADPRFIDVNEAPAMFRPKRPEE